MHGSPPNIFLLSFKRRSVLRIILALLPVILVFDATRVANSQPRIYRFGIPPWQKDLTVDDIRGRYKPLLEWLSQRLNCKFVIVGAKDYTEISGLLAAGKIQIATISPTPYILAQEKNPGVKMLVTELSWNSDRTRKTDSYRGYILSLKSRSDINSIADLKGKRFGFVDRKSTSGFVVPNSYLREQGIDYRTYFSRFFFLGSHPRVTDAIVAGSLDAGTTWDFNWAEAIAKHGNVFKVLWTSPPIPNLGIAVHPSVTPDIQKQLQTALVNAPPQLLKGLSANGYVVRPESFYNSIRRMQKYSN